MKTGWVSSVVENSGEGDENPVSSVAYLMLDVP